MVEITVRDFLAENLPTPVFMEFPVDPVTRFVILRKTDSGRENRLDSAMFVADSYGESLLEAAKLNELVKAAMDDLTDLDVVSASEPAGDYPAFDEKNKRYRYQAVFNITYYEEGVK